MRVALRYHENCWVKNPLDSKRESFEDVVEVQPSPMEGECDCNLDGCVINEDNRRIKTKLVFDDGTTQVYPMTTILPANSTKPTVEVTSVLQASLSGKRPISSFVLSQKKTYGVGTSIAEDAFGDIQHTNVILTDDGAHHTSSRRRGMITTRETANRSVYNEPTRCQGSRIELDDVWVPPVEGDEVFTIETNNGTIRDVVNVRVGESWIDSTYAVDKSDGTVEYVDEIHDADGSLYTVCAKSKGRFDEGTVRVSTEHRVVGITVSSDQFSSDVYVRIIGLQDNSDSVICKKVCRFDKLESILVKHPDGSVNRELPELAYRKIDKIPLYSSKMDIEITDTLTSENLRTILAARLSGVLQPSHPNSHNFDYECVVSGYPELDEVLRGVKTIDDVKQLNEDGQLNLSDEDIEWIQSNCSSLQP